jgi:curved DNA-binding protein CbpA
MPGAGDPFAVLGVARGATEEQIHAAYRAAVRRTHPDAGGSAAEFEAVQQAYETLRDPAARARLARDGASHTQERPAPARPSATAADDPAETRRRMQDLLAESQRLEDEARRLAGMAPRYEEPAAGEEGEDTIAAVLRDAGTQLADAAQEGVRGLRRFLRRTI